MQYGRGTLKNLNHWPIKATASLLLIIIELYTGFQSRITFLSHAHQKVAVLVLKSIDFNASAFFRFMLL